MYSLLASYGVQLEFNGREVTCFGQQKSVIAAVGENTIMAHGSGTHHASTTSILPCKALKRF